jgi:hypothetical protein
MFFFFFGRCTSIVTAKVLEEYKDLITNTTTDLEERLQEIDAKLQTPSVKCASLSDEDATERQQTQEERDSTQQCLGICAQASTQAKQKQINIFQGISIGYNSHQVFVSTIGDLISARCVSARTRSL